jgi:hypothetical protein
MMGRVSMTWRFALLFSYTPAAMTAMAVECDTTLDITHFLGTPRELSSEPLTQRVFRSVLNIICFFWTENKKSQLEVGTYSSTAATIIF